MCGAVVEHPGEISPAWITAALRRGGADVEVRGLTHERIGSGQIGACWRLHLQHVGGGPDSVILKTAAGTAEQRSRVRRGYRAEVCFYQSFARAARIRTPHCWHAAITEDGLAFTLLLEDARPAVAGSQERGCDLGQAAEALRNLAGLHAPFWNNRALDEEAGWLAMTEARAEALARTHQASTELFVSRFANDLAPGEGDVLHRAADLTCRWLLESGGPRSLLHGDYRLDNMLFPPAGGGAVVAVDWQTLDIGLPGRDLAYFLATALDAETRRQQEGELLRAYHDRLLACGVRGYSLEDCRTHYRRGLLQAPFVGIIGFALATGEASERSDRMFLSMARRAVRAIQDLEVLELFSA